MKKRFLSLLALALLLCGCAQEQTSGETETKYVLTQYQATLYTYFDILDEGVSYTYRYNYAYDGDGNKVEERYYRDDEPDGKCKYTYDENGMVVKEVQYEYHFGIPVPSNRWEYSYDEQGRQIGCVGYEGWEKTFQRTSTYNDDGTLRSDAYWPNGSVYEYTYNASGQMTSVRSELDGVEHETVYTYDENGNTLTMHEYEDGVLSMYVLYEYDSQGRKSCSARYDGQGNVINTWDYEYDDAQNQETVYYTDGDWQVNSYDEHGNLVRCEQYNADGVMTSQADYTYRAIQVTVQGEE